MARKQAEASHKLKKINKINDSLERALLSEGPNKH